MKIWIDGDLCSTTTVGENTSALLIGIFAGRDDLILITPRAPSPIGFSIDGKEIRDFAVVAGIEWEGEP